MKKLFSIVMSFLFNASFAQLNIVPMPSEVIMGYGNITIKNSILVADNYFLYQNHIFHLKFLLIFIYVLFSYLQYQAGNLGYLIGPFFLLPLTKYGWEVRTYVNDYKL